MLIGGGHQISGLDWGGSRQSSSTNNADFLETPIDTRRGSPKTLRGSPNLIGGVTLLIGGGSPKKQGVTLLIGGVTLFSVRFETSVIVGRGTHQTNVLNQGNRYPQVYPGTWGPWTPGFFWKTWWTRVWWTPVFFADLTPGLVDPGLDRNFKIWTHVFP